jgi:excisionase family DNA binding protein
MSDKREVIELADAIAQRIKGTPEPRLLTLAQAEAYTGIGATTLRELIRARKLPRVDVDRYVRIDRRDLDKLIDSAKIA